MIVFLMNTMEYCSIQVDRQDGTHFRWYQRAWVPSLPEGHLRQRMAAEALRLGRRQVRQEVACKVLRAVWRQEAENGASEGPKEANSLSTTLPPGVKHRKGVVMTHAITKRSPLKNQLCFASIYLSI